jgi:peptidoglycan-N-acetylglucosamine deacetylase
MASLRHSASILGMVLALLPIAPLAMASRSPEPSRDGATVETSPDAFQPASVRPRPGRVALTFDDGPHPHWTIPLLDLLDRHGVRATFFVLGEYVQAYPEIAREIARRGHSVQNHTWSHPILTSLPEASIRLQFERTGDAITRHTGTAAVCMRPPYMETNDRVRRVARSIGLVEVLWDQDPQEWRTRSVSLTVDDLLAHTKPGDIILLHDALGAVVLPALGVLIPALQARGMEFDRICADPEHDPVYPRRLTPAGEMR